MSEPKKEATTKQILAEVEAGTPVTQIASKLDIDRTTVWRHLKEAAIEFRRGNQEALGELVAKLVDEYFSNYDGVGAGTLDPAKAAVRTKILDSIAKLTGANAESRAVVAHVSATVDDPQKLGPYQRFCFETRGLGMEDMGPVWELLAKIRAAKGPRVIEQPPKDSPLWHPKPKELSE